MSITKKLEGLGVAIVTPFLEDSSVDYKGLSNLIEHLISGGCDFLVVLGTTGEAPTIPDDERYAIMDFVKEKNQGRLPIVAGFGGNDTAHVLKAMREYDMTGIDAILSVAPYYNKPTQEGLYQHFKAIAEACPVPVVLYNVPGRSSCNILPEITLRLSKEVENIVAIKEASGSFSQFMNIISKKDKDFLFLSGDDNLTLPVISIGGRGVVSVLGNSHPKEMKALLTAAMEGDFETARRIHYKLLPLMQLIFKEGNPAGIKAILKIMGICGDTVRLPLANVGEATYGETVEALR